ncbi:isoprenylcysteine carboxyl methyltransferase [Candidatus Peregrinibacteria bacterium CG10_big_fil_rev_8_21_14_0_10_49_24]|nr:MAG: isoprenylcysteine carboxyl methyltransferase [Candidatus Peregrinibacteria bacterium CG11_big_fil_rev_8_21_14_0_20_49_14]PIR51333.1 MAG: isoprenylcysteine carboxyl methyltransferase [Candidatus Peregrinibacteria bacterium CG10_big_fil_rev_8_21_14_0_10_49_24]PJA68097.1 MAG: isoprenylcysteine carboxyl methyltransferase [Candidatus Peregrinibacteria bacterium CG_4_9_14_3_um_filter_49_12]
MNPPSYDYGLWSLVIINSVLILAFALSLFKPKTKTDWHTFGAFSAFIVALFTEMYGFPLTIYFFSGWLTRRYPGIDLYAHENGHLLEIFFGSGSNPHFGILHIISNILIVAGFVMISSAWKELYNAQKKGMVASGGLYKYVRHPQYDGFVLIMLGFLFQWPTIITLAMFPVLLIVYYRLAFVEEKDCMRKLGQEYEKYRKKVPRRFIPRFLPSSS